MILDAFRTTGLANNQVCGCLDDQGDAIWIFNAFHDAFDGEFTDKLLMNLYGGQGRHSKSWFGDVIKARDSNIIRHMKIMLV